MTSLDVLRFDYASPEPAADLRDPAPQRLDVAVLVYDFRGSGVIRQATQIAAEAARDGLNVEVWALRDGGAMRARTPADVPAVIVGPAGFDPRRLLPRAADSALLVGALARTLASRRPAVLFSAGNHMHAFAVAAMAHAAPRPATRLVGRASNAVVGAVARPGAGPLGSLASRLSRTVQRGQYTPMQHIVAVAGELAGDLVGQLGVAPDKITVIPNGVDVDAVGAKSAQPLDHPWFAPGAPPVILGVGRLAYQKNFPLLLDAFALASRERPLRLVIVGEGSGRAALERKARALGVADKVWLTGFDPNPYRYMARAGLLAVSSRWEGASNVVLEAMACGCPVVATAVPTGLAEVLGNGTWGPLAAPGQPAELARIMLERLDQLRDSDRLESRARDFGLAPSLRAYAGMLRHQVRLARAGPTPVNS